MVSKTRRRQLRRSNLVHSFDQVAETPNVSTNGYITSQNGGKFGPALSEVGRDAMVKNAAERELLKYGIDRSSNNARTEVIQSSSKTKNLLIDDVEQSDVNGSRAAHFVVGEGNIGLNRSRRV